MIQKPRENDQQSTMRCSSSTWCYQHFPLFVACFLPILNKFCSKLSSARILGQREWVNSLRQGTSVRFKSEKILVATELAGVAWVNHRQMLENPLGRTAQQDCEGFDSISETIKGWFLSRLFVWLSSDIHLSSLLGAMEYDWNRSDWCQDVVSFIQRLLNACAHQTSSAVNQFQAAKQDSWNWATHVCYKQHACDFSHLTLYMCTVTSLWHMSLISLSTLLSSTTITFNKTQWLQTWR